ncbi:hypothetical protein NA57DRAFT_52667 [Rhizodiscina lignyota]|uniref:Heterokaryon incompatibility domain-containing protein n=1 Tax=Rhizodiscina lignyota TaxID=1504668 RepID=A0A9P4MAD2_9PEZI|nr:hypothetical protein NA57DRAFT_52667 [Rhizodiscina lignyota]
MVMMGTLVAKADGPAAKFVSDRVVEPDVEDAIQLAQTWMNTCLSGHTRCSASEVPLLPIRVVDVEVTATLNCKLHISSPGERRNYLTLSYCLGVGEKGHVLTQNNLSEKESRCCFHNSEVAASVPLGKILQDSLEDWETEAAKMGDIYANSTLTIAAASAADARQGILLPRPPTLPESPPLQFTCPDGNSGTVFLRHTDPSDVEEPLNLRGWALQERLLTPRTLFFGTHQMTWECRETVFAEGKSDYSGIRWSGRNPLSDIHPFSQTLPLTSSEVLARWEEVVSDYTSRNLTLGTDKLPALAGIAAIFKSAFGNDGYLAGLWKSSLPCGLLWAGIGSEHLERKLLPYRAPSWSWMSVDGSVTTMRRDSKDPVCATIIHAGVTGRAPQSLTSCLSGKLIVRAPVRRPSKSKLLYNSANPRHNIRGFYFDGGENDGPNEPLEKYREQSCGICEFDDYDEMLQADSTQLLCLRKTLKRGLMILPVAGTDVFRRVGYCTIYEEPLKFTIEKPEDRYEDLSKEWPVREIRLV